MAISQERPIPPRRLRGRRWSSAFDSVLVLAYDVEQGIAESFIKGFFRRDGSLRLSIPKAGNYHCYLGFVAEDQSRQSNSQYLGQMEVV